MSPLIKSRSKHAVSENIKTEMEAGKPQRQSIAIALEMKRRAGKKKKMAMGGDIGKHEADVLGMQDRDVKMPSDLKADIDTNQAAKGLDMVAMERIRHKAEMRRLGMPVADDSDEESLHMVKMAEGGDVEDEDDKMISGLSDAVEGLDDEEKRRRRMAMGGAVDESMKDNSIQGAMDKREMSVMRSGGISDAIMRKRKMAEGGEVDLQANSDEDLNLEDQLSFDAARKKTYYDNSQLKKQPMDSNEMGDEREDEEENEHDMTSSIRKRMKSKKLI